MLGNALPGQTPERGVGKLNEIVALGQVVFLELVRVAAYVVAFPTDVPSARLDLQVALHDTPILERTTPHAGAVGHQEGLVTEARSQQAVPEQMRLVARDRRVSCDAQQVQNGGRKVDVK